ncbi:AAA family ATPase [Methylomonas methanica]|uniref:AAA ATPase central domain protein n=1 Tax=Methylomonas methanica (strain DSM 25384 / MC09) TaxID=857087 RepID=G0A0Y2_METMM|nr:ATP-binding protein [Methylomonas methanica]AEG01238.1 AAA ATPase central domain protein [Methylomonas methanica MC09]
MKLQIEKRYLEPLLTEHPRLHTLSDQLRLGNKAQVSYDQLSEVELASLAGIYSQAGEALQQQAALLNALQQAMSAHSQRYNAEQLEMLLPAIARYLLDGAIRGWLFHVEPSGRTLAYLITRLDYTPPGEEEAGRILIELKANSKGKIANETLIIRSKDLADKTIPEIFAGKCYLKETADLIAGYDEAAGRYFDWRARYGEQFSGWGTGIYADDPTASHRSSDWTRKNTVVLSSGGGACRLVNDENILSERALSLDASGDILGTYLRKAGKSMRYDSKTEAAMEAYKEEVPAGLFTELPMHGYILTFHLELHHHVWVHVDDMQPYVYQPELKQKLILPPEQTDLIDILTAEMDMLTDDIVAGKSGGTTVLCAGPAGVGKTLTAEVYSEIIKRPLYRVHSGQLGLNVAEMEKTLKDTLIRAQRWGAVMLIDEADVYIKKRADNLASNAVVGVFLRVLEYFNGLLFMTTNRVDDIDEAIISRCIAMIRYHSPDHADRCKIWRVMTQQFSLPVAETLIDELASVFPGASGRDIKGLTKLVAKFCQQKQLEPDLDVFKRCSVFRGLELAEI